MPRSDRKSNTNDQTPLHKKKNALLEEAEQIKAQLKQARQFLQQAPGMKAEAQRKEQQEILNKFRRPARIEGPSDFRLELVKGRPDAKPRTLRRERSLAPMMLTVVLLAACVVVGYYAVRILSNS
jgi:hypothetical protein